MTVLDWVFIAAILALVLSVILAWNGPVPTPLMRPAHVFKLGERGLTVRSQSNNGDCAIEIPVREVGVGDVVFIEQVGARAQYFYIKDWGYVDGAEIFMSLELTRKDPLGK